MKILAKYRKARCWVCDIKYSRVYEIHGGIKGHCNECDSDRWVLTPSGKYENGKKVRRKNANSKN
ncbi:MAG: hypothetical protein KAS32_04220 [Candidatus Peribacteraceae bacterium]|nr:hypothetical protein [Candidatus Peribacteraceae bacterium]